MKPPAISNDQFLDRLERAMNVLSRRQQLVASNVSNIDTPGYRTQDIDFKSALSRAVGSASATLPLQQTSPAHMSGAVSPKGDPEAARHIANLAMRNDGNDVNIDREMMNLAETRARFDVTTNVAKMRLKQLISAIEDGEELVSLDRAMKVAASALSMQRARMEIISSNMANAQTTRTAEGGPYVRRMPAVHAVPVEKGPGFEDALSRAVKGVSVTSVASDPRPPLMKYEPGHPDANKDGYVAYPNVNPVEEMVDMMSAMRSYEAGTNVVKTVQRMNDTALSIIR